MAQEYDKYGDSYYSQIPTNDKKYECRTGPFEGFFTSSVEICKHVKFDDKDRKDNNRTGTQGPPGPPGATGATGITIINGTNYYSVTGATTTIPPGEFAATSFASSDPEDVALSGEYVVDAAEAGTTGTYDVVIFNTVGGNPEPDTTWQTQVNGLVGTEVQTKVNCFDNPPLRP
jgi:hypothetical protein